MKTYVMFLAALLGGSALQIGGASATLTLTSCVSENACAVGETEYKVFLDKSPKGGSTTGTGTAFGTGLQVGFSSNTALDFSSGFATINAAGGGTTFTNLVVTAPTDYTFTDLIFAAQLTNAGGTVNIVDNLGSTGSIVAGNGANNFFKIVSDTPLTSLTFNAALGTEIKNMRQFQISGLTSGNGNPPPVTGVPEPSTWAMMLMGLAGLGVAGYRRRKTASA